MQFWKGQRVILHGLHFGRVYQDQGLDQTVKVALDRGPNVIESVQPRDLVLIRSENEEEMAEQFIKRQWLP